MSPFEAYLLYIALRNHFKLKTYDFFKYNGRTNATIESFTRRSDKWIFEKLAKLPDPKGYLVANFVSGEDWVGDFEIGEKNYRAKQKIWQSLSYQFDQDIRKLGQWPSGQNAAKELIKIQNNDQIGGLPFIIDHYLQLQISLETLVLFCSSMRCYSYWNKYLKDNVIWSHMLQQKISKYEPFLNFNREKCKQSFLRLTSATTVI